MSIFLSKTDSYPYVEITRDLPKIDITSIQETKNYNTIDVIDTIYLIILKEHTKTELRVKIVNESKIGSSLWLSKLDEFGVPIKWEQMLKFTEGLDTSQNINDEIVIPIKIKWSTINNVYLNRNLIYNAIVNIYDIVEI